MGINPEIVFYPTFILNLCTWEISRQLNLAIKMAMG